MLYLRTSSRISQRFRYLQNLLKKNGTPRITSGCNKSKLVVLVVKENKEEKIYDYVLVPFGDYYLEYCAGGWESAWSLEEIVYALLNNGEFPPRQIDNLYAWIPVTTDMPEDNNNAFLNALGTFGGGYLVRVIGLLVPAALGIEVGLAQIVEKCSDYYCLWL